MKIYLDARQAAHRGAAEFTGGRMLPCYDSPLRLETIASALGEAGFAPPESPDDRGLEPILAAHDPAFVRFLQTAWRRWEERFGDRDALPWNFATRSLPSHRPPDTVEGEMAYHALDAGAPIMRHTWEAAYWSAQSAIAAAHIVTDGRAAFALCRPPGHHAGRDVYGAYCYLNNAGIAAETLRALGFSRVAILDVDYHHGNGAQSMFYARPDVATASLHGDPRTTFPYFSGHADEFGHGAGEGSNLNLPLPDGADDAVWQEGVAHVAAWVSRQRADALIVALGLDTAAEDPVSTFRLSRDAFSRTGEAIARLGLPTMFVLEGGYALEAVGAASAAFCQAFAAVGG